MLPYSFITMINLLKLQKRIQEVEMCRYTLKLKGIDLKKKNRN